jgi:hypothetical protein
MASSFSSTDTWAPKTHLASFRFYRCSSGTITVGTQCNRNSREYVQC